MKITKYFINHAQYRAEDEKGNLILIDINYWENNFKISQKNKDLENFARKLLGKKHRVNLVHKMLE